jgi:hypothetical protein
MRIVGLWWAMIVKYNAKRQSNGHGRWQGQQNCSSCVHQIPFSLMNGIPHKYNTNTVCDGGRVSVDLKKTIRYIQYWQVNNAECAKQGSVGNKQLLMSWSLFQKLWDSHRSAKNWPQPTNSFSSTFYNAIIYITEVDKNPENMFKSKFPLK